MAQIRKLSESLIAKIAAGEVIERPASVVKELVENSIDAGARSIRVEIEEGGRRAIRVIDDGCGMGGDEALLALERHATSKISSESDLFKIQTLGFRGEALPSIAAVSHLVLESAGEGGQAGIRIEVEGGRVLRSLPCARNRGTTIEVRNLFFNTPARLKFLKSESTEFSHIANLVEGIALSRPEVGFDLTHQTGSMKKPQREFQSPSRGEMRERIRDLKGDEIAAALVAVRAGRNGMELVGWAGNNAVTSSSAKSLYFFVNGRLIRDRTLQHAVLSGYEGLVMKHRYPFIFLYLSVPPDLVDVNVHPTKAEVRFAQGSLVHDLVREGVRGVLRGEATPVSLPHAPSPPAPLPQAVEGCTVEPSPVYGRGEMEPMLSSRVRVVGQVHSTYLVCETPDKLILIDQHAAHERIGLEKLKRQYETGGIERQALLFPQNFEMKPSEAEILKLYLSDLEKFGFELDPSGRSSFLLRAVPRLLEGEDFVPLIHELVEELQSFGKLTPIEEKMHEVLETIACHRQIRAGEMLTHQEIGALISEMERTDYSHSCAHGRPTKVEIPFVEIEKWFKRRL